MPGRLLPPAELARPCDPASLAPNGDDDGPAAGALPAVVGQTRALEAITHALELPSDGHHLFVMGLPGVGKHTLVRHAIAQHLARRASGGGERTTEGHRDWVCVADLAAPHRPRVLCLPRGRARPLQRRMQRLADDLQALLPAVFSSSEYAAELRRVQADDTPPDEDPPREVAGSAAATRPLGGALRAAVQLQQARARRRRALDQALALHAVGTALAEVKAEYGDLPEVLHWLDALCDGLAAQIANTRAALAFADAEFVGRADNARVERGAAAGDTASAFGAGFAPDLSACEVNVLVDAGANDAPPVVFVDQPTVARLVGSVAQRLHGGTLRSDHRHVRAGALHLANGGYLLVEAAPLLAHAPAWETLKLALTRRAIHIEPAADASGLAAAPPLQPLVVPLSVKVVLFGERELCEQLHEQDADFTRVFRVVADFADELPRSEPLQRALARSLGTQAVAQGLLPAGPAALARLVEHAARLAGDAQRLTGAGRKLLDVLAEADRHARAAARQHIEAADIAAAVAARRRRAARIDERMREELRRGMLMIDTTGARAGQVNALMIYETGGETFGEPVRVTATTRLGDGEVIDIQRETHLGGPVHAKGVLILAAFLGARYSRFHAHALFASLVFEQTYSLVEGDSASLAELVALLSSIADVPLAQSLAVTGSVNQFGDVQAIGGVNEKIESFFDICAARGLDGRHGVVLPEANVPQLMLRDDVVQAVTDGRFTLHAVRHVDEAMEVMTGLPAGEPHAPHAETLNGRIVARLREYARLHDGEKRWPRRTRAGAGAQADGVRANASGRPVRRR